MSAVFELDTQGQRAVEQEALANGMILGDLPPSFFEGVGTGIGKGVMKGGARVGQFLGMAAAAPAVLFDKVAGTESADAVFRAVDSVVNSAVDYWTPAANEVGTAGRVLGGLSEITLPLMAGAGNPSLLIGSQEMGTATDLVRQGADVKAAVGVGMAQGFATAVGFKIPFFGENLLTKMATGALGNLAVNTGTSAVSQQVLKATGDDALAEQFDPFNAEARIVDVLTGLAFGGIAHFASVPHSFRDAAITTANAKHFQQDTAPGIPADAKSSVAHQAAMEVATQSLLEGKPVEVSQTKAAEVEFLQKPSEPVAPEVKAALDEYDTPTVELPILEMPQAKVVEFETAKGSLYEVHDDGATTRDKAPRPEHPGDEGPQPRSERTFYVQPEDAVKLGEFQAEGGLKRSIEAVDDNRIGMRYAEGKDAGRFEGRTVVPFQKEPAVGLTPVETFKGGTRVHFGNEITKVSTAGKALEAHADPVIAAAHEIAAQTDHKIPVSDESGNVTTLSAKELMSRSMEVTKQAGNDAKGFMAAALCFMQVGQ